MPDSLQRPEQEDAEAWQYQLRIHLADKAAQAARNKEEAENLKQLNAILKNHNAEIVCQYDAFSGYCEQAERLGQDDLPLYKWTKDTIDNPKKKAKYIKIFTIYVDGEEVYEKEAAEALENELNPMVGGTVIEKLSKYDSNPANNPQAPKKYRS